jgi:hypothetical protein
LPDEKFMGFMHEQLTISQAKINNGLSKSDNLGDKRREILIYQTSSVLEVMQFDERIKKFTEDNPELKKYVAKEEEILIQYEKSIELLPIEKKKLIKETPSLALAKKIEIANAITLKKINESKELEELSPEKRQEFDAILVDVYRHNEKVSPELNEIYFPDMKVEIEQKEREINQTNLNVSKSFADSQKTVLENKEFNKYFSDNYVYDFIDE